MSNCRYVANTSQVTKYLKSKGLRKQSSDGLLAGFFVCYANSTKSKVLVYWMPHKKELRTTQLTNASKIEALLIERFGPMRVERIGLRTYVDV